MSTENNKLTSIDETDDLELADENNELELADEMPPDVSLIKEAPESIESFVEPNAKNWKVMIVDDEPEIHQVIRLVLNKLAFQGKSLSVFKLVG